MNAEDILPDAAPLPDAIPQPETLPPDTDVTACTTEELRDMLAAGDEILECFRVLGKAKANVVGQVLKNNGTFYEQNHYPPGDVYDRETFSQYYYHAHRKETGEHGHFHLFVRGGAIPDEMTPPDDDGPGAEKRPLGSDAICHLVAISMDKAGLPTGLFTTNRWVTAETFFAAEDVAKLAERFAIDHVYPCWATNRWLTAMLKLFRPQVARLNLERDRTLANWKARYPDRDLYEDRELEVTSELRIDIDAQIAAVENELRRRGHDPDPGA